ncbi:hypothetical protein F2P56_032753 [Juglans regia]|uniref:Uclacyanin-3-like n=2 Tax=Juglans regia TaxID=51240 RepID=A0A2I4EJB5_JUGRE|nr:uclacyanin-3-like [Juglans regia]KAF5447184.1 hypothetical protein F2P56_032753 [Juglans regia]
MAALPKFCISLLFAFSLVELSVPAHAPDSSPSPAPAFGAESPLPRAPESNVRAPVNPPSTLSPPAPSPANLPPDSSPTPKSQAPTPKPRPVADNINPEKSSGSGKEEKSSSDGMSRGKKAGILVAVIVAAGLAVVAGLVYKKRRDNIRRGQYGNALRREIL